MINYQQCMMSSVHDEYKDHDGSFTNDKEGSRDEKQPLLSSSSFTSSSRSTSVASSPVPVRATHHLPGRGTKLCATLCILFTELCERLTFYGLTANLLLFCKDMLDFKVPLPTTVNLLFQGSCYFTPLFFGWIADSFYGRYNTIYASSLMYFVGTFLIVIVAADDKSQKHNIYRNYMGCHKESCLLQQVKVTFFVFGLLLIALGTGGIKANVSPFGADQVQSDGPRAVQRFFNWFYWFINIGSFFAFTGVVYVQQSFSFFYGYSIIFLSMLLTNIIFLLGRYKYIVKPPGGSVLADTLKVIGQALSPNQSTVNSFSPISWLDKAKIRFGGTFSESQVEDVKSLLRLFPVFLMFIMYWAIYSQMQTSYLIQGTYMNLKIGHLTIPVASLSIFDIIIVLLLIPVMDKIIYPFLRYCGINFTPLQRVGVGMLFAAASVLVAGIVETSRRNDANHQTYQQKVFGSKVNASEEINIFYQAPQFLLIGTSEVLTSITGMEFAYSQSPRCLQGLVMGMFLVTTGLGSYFAMALVNIVQAANPKWYPKNLNQGNLEYYFFLLSGLMMLNFFIYLIVATKYKYVRHPRERYADSNNSHKENVDAADNSNTDDG